MLFYPCKKKFSKLYLLSKRLRLYPHKFTFVKKNRQRRFKSFTWNNPQLERIPLSKSFLRFLNYFEESNLNSFSFTRFKNIWQFKRQYSEKIDLRPTSRIVLKEEKKKYFRSAENFLLLSFEESNIKTTLLRNFLWLPKQIYLSLQISRFFTQTKPIWTKKLLLMIFATIIHRYKMTGA